MPRYYFNIRDDSWLYVADTEGELLPDLECAIRVALSSARWILKDDVRVGTVKPERDFEIADKEGNILAKVKFKDALNHPDSDARVPQDPIPPLL